MKAREREDRLNIFRSDPSVTVILISLKCGSLGLNLTCANRVCLMDVVGRIPVFTNFLFPGLTLSLTVVESGD